MMSPLNKIIRTLRLNQGIESPGLFPVAGCSNPVIGSSRRHAFQLDRKTDDRLDRARGWVSGEDTILGISAFLHPPVCPGKMGKT
jgi:hypothetical protein